MSKCCGINFANKLRTPHVTTRCDFLLPTAQSVLESTLLRFECCVRTPLRLLLIEAAVEDTLKCESELGHGRVQLLSVAGEDSFASCARIRCDALRTMRLPRFAQPFQRLKRPAHLPARHRPDDWSRSSLQARVQ